MDRTDRKNNETAIQDAKMTLFIMKIDLKMSAAARPIISEVAEGSFTLPTEYAGPVAAGWQRADAM